MIVALLSALTTEVLGFKYMLGPVLLGLFLPGGMPLGTTLTEHLDSFFTTMFLPVYVVLAGYRTDLKELDHASRCVVISHKVPIFVMHQQLVHDGLCSLPVQT
jgi:Kef-type K+ transport system membrane component KefB